MLQNPNSDINKCNTALDKLKKFLNVRRNDINFNEYTNKDTNHLQVVNIEDQFLQTRITKKAHQFLYE